jgi:hypothetical protein
MVFMARRYDAQGRITVCYVTMSFPGRRRPEDFGAIAEPEAIQ